MALTEQTRLHAEAQRLSAQIDVALSYGQLLLAVSEEMSGTATVGDVLAAVSRLASGGLDATHVSLALPRRPPGRPARRRWRGCTRAWRHLVAVVQPEFASRGHPDRPAAIPRRPGLHPQSVPRPGRIRNAAGWQAIAVAPLIVPSPTLGAFIVAWDRPHRIDLQKQAVIVSLAGYITAAIQRAAHLDDRVQAAATLQRAMLTPLPKVDHLRIAAWYQPAHSRDQVGGDWYDAVATSEHSLSVVIGDVAGHDIRAAAAMGQLGRAACLPDRPA